MNHIDTMTVGPFCCEVIPAKQAKGPFVLIFENTVKPVIRGHSTVHLQISMFDKVFTSMWPAHRILFIDGEVPK